MNTAKDIRVMPITSKDANEIVKRIHYSHKVVNNSQLHLGVFLNGKLEGCMSFGPSMDKKKVLGLVRDTSWNGFLELNRMAFSDLLPRNSESRALSIAFKLIKKHYPHIEWIISFADGCQCGDGTIYRASGFVLTGIKENKTIMRMPDGECVANITLEHKDKTYWDLAKKWNIAENLTPSPKNFISVGARYVPGFMLRYIYFLNPDARNRLTVPIIPFSRIDEMGARMVRGKHIECV